MSPSFRRSTTLRRTVALFLIPLAATSVATHGSTRYVLRGPRIATDTLLGVRGKDSVAVALRDVARVDVRRFSPVKTAAFFLVLGIVVAVPLLYVNSDAFAH